MALVAAAWAAAGATGGRTTAWAGGDWVQPAGRSVSRRLIDAASAVAVVAPETRHRRSGRVVLFFFVIRYAGAGGHHHDQQHHEQDHAATARLRARAGEDDVSGSRGIGRVARWDAHHRLGCRRLDRLRRRSSHRRLVHHRGRRLECQGHRVGRRCGGSHGGGHGGGAGGCGFGGVQLLAGQGELRLLHLRGCQRVPAAGEPAAAAATAVPAAAASAACSCLRVRANFGFLTFGGRRPRARLRQVPRRAGPGRRGGSCGGGGGGRFGGVQLLAGQGELRLLDLRGFGGHGCGGDRCRGGLGRGGGSDCGAGGGRLGGVQLLAGQGELRLLDLRRLGRNGCHRWLGRSDRGGDCGAGGGRFGGVQLLAGQGEPRLLHLRWFGCGLHGGRHAERRVVPCGGHHVRCCRRGRSGRRRRRLR